MPSAEPSHPLSSIKALTFDLFGTTFDWRASVQEELVLRAHRKLSSDAASEVLKRRLRTVTERDWGRFAQEWRNSYLEFVRGFGAADADADGGEAGPDAGTAKWKTVDEHHGESLVRLLDAWHLGDLYSDAEIHSLSLVWHRLRPWADVVDGLARIRAGGITLAALTNGNRDLVKDLVDFGGLDFDGLFCADTFRVYKPHPGTYLGAARAMGLEPGQVAMVACHMGDLVGARACGLRTIYVERRGEEAMDEEGDEFCEARRWVDLWIGKHEEGFAALADRLLRLVPS
ncbi:hypothetical protein E4U43_005930 [Claviceps pusilla]|uniref:Haloacid dehalogenase, type II n=1 Tax=Claviceps pusilla TaxID=123648 RepID=A0A9P7N2W7_9HYPO|nr:hypothetical protein E4U43_005930 [Claviceps pusilla]